VGQRDGFLSQTPRRPGANHRVIRGMQVTKVS
jgi:hypothetical protein